MAPARLSGCICKIGRHGQVLGLQDEAFRPRLRRSDLPQFITDLHPRQRNRQLASVPKIVPSARLDWLVGESEDNVGWWLFTYGSKPLQTQLSG